MLRKAEEKLNSSMQSFLAAFGIYPSFPQNPPFLTIEGTNLCNSDCVFCPNSKMKRKREELDMELFKSAVDQMSFYRESTVYLCATIGEPLLDSQLMERLEYLKKYKAISRNLGFYTTLQWLHRYDINQIFDSGIKWLSISTALSGSDSYKQFFGVNLYRQMLENLENLLNENNKRSLPIRIRIRVKPTNESEADIINHPDFMYIQSLTKQDLVEEVRKNRISSDTWNGLVNLPSYLKPRDPIADKRIPCDFLYSGLNVFSNGKVSACLCRDVEANSELTIGDLRTETIEQIWNGEKLAALRQNWIEQKIPTLCQKCLHYKPKRVRRKI